MTPSVSLVLVLGLLGAVSSKTLTVCPSGCEYSVPSQAVRAAGDNDIVLITGPYTYKDCFYVTATNLTIMGKDENEKPHLQGLTCGGKAVIVVQKTETKIKNLEISGMAVADHNGAAIRHEVGALTVENCYFHDGEEGILTGNDLSLSLYVSGTEFARLGTWGPPVGRAHGIYAGKISSLVVKDSSFHDNTGEGHELKSRAMSTKVCGCFLGGMNGEDSRTIDLPNGGNATLYANTIEKGPNSSNGQIVGYGMEESSSGANPIQKLYVEKNTFISDCTSHVVTHLALAPQPKDGLTVISNQFVAGNHILTVAGQNEAVDSSNALFRSRADAGLSPYPYVPQPPPCPW